MVKPLPLLIMAGLLVGCASEPQAETAQKGVPDLAQVSCYQAGWQAETVPIVYKRGGPEVWEKYDFMPAVGPVACR
jgi:putative hemolysin